MSKEKGHIRVYRKDDEVFILDHIFPGPVYLLMRPSVKKVHVLVGERSRILQFILGGADEKERKIPTKVRAERLGVRIY